MAKGVKGFTTGNKVGRKFTRLNQPHKKGRKPSLYKNLINKTELSREDFIIVLRYIMERSPNELESLVKDGFKKPNRETPVWIINIISAINADIKHGETKTLNTLFDYLFGKPRASVNVKQAVNNVPPELELDFSSLSEDEMKELDELMLKIKVKRK